MLESLNEETLERMNKGAKDPDESRWRLERAMDQSELRVSGLD